MIAICGYMDIWQPNWKPILLIRLSLKGVTQHIGGKGDAYRTHGCDKSMLLAYLIWGREPAWRLARGDHQEGRHRVGEATHPGVFCFLI